MPTPDVITFQLGVNDISNIVVENREEKVRKILADADTFITAFKKDIPNAIIGVAFITPAADQDAFGKVNKCRGTAWLRFQNQFYLNNEMQKHFAAKHPDIIMIPTGLGVDSENNFPVRKESVSHGTKNTIYRQDNGVHPAVSGYNQLGDIYYAWLKNILAGK